MAVIKHRLADVSIVSVGDGDTPSNVSDRVSYESDITAEYSAVWDSHPLAVTIRCPSTVVHPFTSISTTKAPPANDIGTVTRVPAPFDLPTLTAPPAL
jgi:hypothetical protein